MADHRRTTDGTKHIADLVEEHIARGLSMNAAYKKVSREIDKGFWAVKKAHQRGRPGATRDHGNCKLKKRDEESLLSVVIVFSLMHELLELSDIAQHVCNFLP